MSDDMLNGSGESRLLRLPENKSAGGFSIAFLGIAVILFALLIFVNAADYALYSIKRSIISKGMDYSVCAAIQQIDIEGSRQGLSTGFKEEDGRAAVENIALNETDADNAFFSTFQANTGISRENIEESVLLAIVNPTDTALGLIIKKGGARYENNVPDPPDIETVINTKINEYWNTADPLNDRHTIYVNGNPKTNEFKKRPYYIAIIKNYEIDGLFRKREATFVGFAGARIERRLLK